jgi:hypothetical protein
MPIRFIARDGLPTAVAVGRGLRGDDDVLVVVNPAVPAAEILELSAMLLRRGERTRLRQSLDDQPPWGQ